MGTLKWHLLGPLIGDLKSFGGIQIVDVGIYEHRYILSKKEFRKTSKRRLFALKSGEEDGIEKNLQKLTR